MDSLLAFASGIAVSLGIGVPGAWYLMRRRARQPVATASTVPHHSQAIEQAMEEATAETEEQFCALLDAMPTPIWMRDPDLNVAFANHAACTQNKDGKTLIDHTQSLAVRAIETGERQNETSTIEEDGTHRILKITETPLGPGKGTIGICLEHQMSADDVINKAAGGGQESLDRMLEALHAGVAIYGPDKHLRGFNSAFANLWSLNEAWLGESPNLSQVIEKLRDERRLPEVTDFKAFRKAENDRFETQTTTREETLYLPDGRAVKQTVAPGAPGESSEGGLTYIFEDITDALAMQRSFKTLDAVQRHTIDNLQEAVALFGSDSRLKLHNAPFAALWKLPDDVEENEPHISDVVDLMREANEDEASWSGRREQIMVVMTRRTKHHDRIRRGDGKVYDLACVPLPDGALLISYLDVTEEDEVESALRARAEILEETDRLKSKFIADVSYEARTPLTTINGFAQIMNAEYFGELNARQKEYVQGIQRTADNLQLIIADILELAAIESGTAALSKDAIDLHALLAHSMELFGEHARSKSLYIAFDVPIDIGWISADEKRLKQVIFNLLSNAIRFTPDRGGVRLSAERTKDEISITVADDGTGIPQADIERIFQKFQKGNQPEGDSGGAGLGLSMVKSFIELHGGHVSIKSPRNRGTTVICTLPATGTEGGDARNAFEA
ncbi:MAG: PAS domain-containing protein [Rhodospirillales bacterium]|jgi:signal transduction histidine kinase|nr:PAS domain-containing protein [Rhodospirillales bacterium]